ncbi:MAG: peptide MFS transporter [Pseudomonadales bacterium]|nr:peptide MFS transporter [Pseudomonadales bacterium]
MAAVPGASTAGEFLGHPKGLFVLFFTEMWERFSYYGMRALLVLYLTKHYLYGDRDAGLILGSYGSLVYAMPVIGGLIADRYLGYRKAITFGAILLVCGHFGMAFEGPPATLENGMIVRDPVYQQVFYLSLAFIIIGVGFLKANISTIVGQLYDRDDPRRDGAFTIFYMGINIGAFVATLACGYIGETYDWRYGFGLAGIGMLAGLLVFQVNRRHLLGYGEPPEAARLDEKILPLLTRERLIYLVGALSVFGIWTVIQRTTELGVILGFAGGAVVLWTLWFSVFRCDPVERDRMIVMLVLTATSVLFWALFEQAGSSLTLFTDRNVDMGGFIKASMFQSLNPFFIMTLAPIFAWLWVRLSRSGYEPTTPTKFGLALMQVGLGFAVLVYGASLAGEDGKVNMIWLALMYLLHTTGELCISPVGLSMVTKLAVARVAAMMMGVWFLSSSFAAYAGGLIAGTMAIDESGGDALEPLAALAVYTEVFDKLAMVSIGLGVVVLLLARFLSRRMHGVH